MNRMQVVGNPETLARAAAEIFIRESARAIASNGIFSVALSGGTTPRRTYEVLALDEYSRKVQWKNIRFFWGDERCVPPDDPRHNGRMARKALLDKVPVNQDQVHEILCAGDPAMAASGYDALLRKFFPRGNPGFDLVFLGLGANGHTASLFPRLMAVEETERWAVEVYIPGQEFWRVTLTLPLLNRSSLIVFLVSGAEKAGILKETLEPSRVTPMFPARRVHPESGDLLWLVDEEAASLLEKK